MVARVKNTHGLNGLRCEIFFNLHSGLFSVRALAGPDKGRVVAHAESFEMESASFVVQKAGRAKVLQSRNKNVHAFVRGTIAIGSVARASDHVESWSRVRYNPYESDSFLAESGMPVKAASAAFGRVTIGDKLGKPRVYALA